MPAVYEVEFQSKTELHLPRKKTLRVERNKDITLIKEI